MLCGIEISMSGLSTIKPNLTTLTVSSKVQSSPKTSAKAGSKTHDFPSRFHIWQGNPCTWPPTNTLVGDERKDKDITSKGEHDVIDLTNEDSSSDDKEQ